MTALTVIGVPTSAGAFTPGQELAPAALRDAGLIGALQARGVEVRDLGDRPVWRWRPDRDNLRAQNLDAVVEITQDTARRVREARAGARGDAPLLVLGGDCTVELGTLAGHLDGDERVGLVWLDLHPDLGTPESVDVGTLDWMGMAHALGVPGAAPELVAAGPRTPMLQDDDVLFLAYGPKRAEQFELDQIAERGLAAIPVDDVAADPEGSAARVLSEFAPRFDRLLVHFDVDVVDFIDAQLSEDAVRNDGLTLDAAMRVVKALTKDARFAALTVTELNPLHGAEDGETIRDFVGRLADALA
jgi:arginase